MRDALILPIFFGDDADRFAAKLRRGKGVLSIPDKTLRNFDSAMWTGG